MPRQVGLSDSMLLKVGEDSAAADKLCAAVFEIACGAHAHMSHADELASQLPAEANAAFLPAVRLLVARKWMIRHHGGGLTALLSFVQVPARRYLAALERANFDLLSPSMAPPRHHLRLQAALLAATIRNTF